MRSINILLLIWSICLLGVAPSSSGLGSPGISKKIRKMLDSGFRNLSEINGSSTKNETRPKVSPSKHLDAPKQKTTMREPLKVDSDGKASIVSSPGQSFRECPPLGQQSLLVKKTVPKEFQPCLKYTSYDGLSNLNPSDFEVKRLIGKGAFGEVFLVYHKTTDRLFAVKKILPRSKVNAKLIEREEALHHYLYHPNIIRHYFSRHNPNGSTFLFLEYVEGKNLGDFILEQDVPISRQQMISIISQILMALRYLHEGGIAHMDVKPSNILIDLNGNVKLIDFGLAIKDDVDRTRGFKGTPAWSAPEVLDLKGNWGRPADLWSVGIIAYFMSTKKMPFTPLGERNRSGFLRAQELGKFKVPLTQDRELDELIELLTIFDQNERYSRVMSEVFGLAFFNKTD